MTASVEQMRRTNASAEDTSQRPCWPLVLRWGQETPALPSKAIEGRSGRHVVGLEAPPWWASGPAECPFDFCGHMERLCTDIVRRCETLAHIDVRRVLFAVTQARSFREHGLQ